MINPQFEVDRLKQNLIFGGYDQREAEAIADHANNDVNSVISELLSGAMAEAIRIGNELGIEDFAKQVRAIKMGSTYSIVTDSGRADFSTPAYPMLPSLLKNAKRAKDGSLYKIIPIKKSPRLQNLIDAQRQVDEDRKLMMEAVKEQNAQQSSAVKSVSPLSGLAAAQQYINKRNELRKQANEQSNQEVTFRTASSKQDSKTMWVQPPRDKNVSMILVDINRKLEDDIQTAVVEVVGAYQSQFLGGVR